jgi:Flp pilus assembly secretin CpaC
VCHGRPGRAIVGRHPGTADTAVAHERQHEINALTIQTDTPVDTLLLECLRRRGVVR